MNTNTTHSAHLSFCVQSFIYLFTTIQNCCYLYLHLDYQFNMEGFSFINYIYIYIHMSWYRSDLRRRALSSHACTKLTGNQRLVYFCRLFWHIQIQKKHHTLLIGLHRFKLKGKYNMDYGLHYTSIHLVHTSC